MLFLLLFFYAENLLRDKYRYVNVFIWKYRRASLTKIISVPRGGFRQRRRIGFKNSFDEKNRTKNDIYIYISVLLPSDDFPPSPPYKKNTRLFFCLSDYANMPIVQVEIFAKNENASYTTRKTKYYYYYNNLRF